MNLAFKLTCIYRLSLFCCRLGKFCLQLAQLLSTEIADTKIAKDNPVLFWLRLPFYFFVGGSLGNGKQYFPWVHIEDVVAAIRFLVEDEQAEGVYNLTAPGTITNKRLAKTLGKVLRRPAIFPLPGFVMRTLFGEVSTVMLDGQNVKPKALLDAGFEFSYPEVEGALREILGR